MQLQFALLGYPLTLAQEVPHQRYWRTEYRGRFATAYAHPVISTLAAFTLTRIFHARIRRGHSPPELLSSCYTSGLTIIRVADHIRIGCFTSV